MRGGLISLPRSFIPFLDSRTNITRKRGKLGMKRANAFFIAAVLLIAAPAAVALAGTVDVDPAPTYAGHAYWDLTTGNILWEAGPGDRTSPLASVDIFKNTANSPLGGISSTDLASQWGDQETTTGTGTLESTTRAAVTS
jgi:hypothetical protein